MEKREALQRLVCAAAAATGLVAAAHADYQPGYVWHRHSDWVPGQTEGGTKNNPGPDTEGTGVWMYGWTTGGGLGSENPWYAQPLTMATWDPDWWNIEQGAWSRGNDGNPPMFANRFTHNAAPSVYQFVPVVEWLNPVGDGTEVALTGTLTVQWSGVNFVGLPVDVAVVIAHYDSVTHVATPLFSTVVSKPIQGPSVGDKVELPIDISGVQLDAGDSLIFSHRAEEPLFPGGWVILYDDVSVTLVPAPGAISLLGLGGLLAARRRRR